MREKKLLREGAANLRADARRAQREGNMKLAKKLMTGAYRLDRWAVEGKPEWVR